MGAGDFLSAETLKSAPLPFLRDVVVEVLQFLQHDKLFIDHRSLLKKAEVSIENELSTEKLQVIINEITHILRIADKLNLSPDGLKEYLKKSFDLPADIIAIISDIRKEKGKQQYDPNLTVEVGQVVDMTWKVGLAVSSDKCKALNFPFVTITLTLALPCGKRTDKTFEMSISEFQNFHEQLQEMASVLATV